MSAATVPASDGPADTGAGGPLQRLLPLLGLAAMYLPVYWAAAGSIWQTDDHAHGPIILLVAAWLVWDRRRALAALPAGSDGRLGWPLFTLGLLTYLAGRAVDSSVLAFGSQPLVMAGVLLLMRGRAAARLLWFPLFYLVFATPLPSLLVDAATGPLKQWISVIAENLLYAAGYPIARSGVVLSIGQYQMLVADACSGLHSMFSLAALGTLFMFLIQRPGWLHNALMAAAILPVAFAANIVRVMILMLVTYHFGDEAGQGFLHGAAGIVLMLTALAAFFGLDALLWAARSRAPHRPAS